MTSLLLFPDTPGAPYKLEPSDIAKDSLNLSWYEPDEDGGSPITGYWMERYEPDHDKWIRCNKLPIKDTNYRSVYSSLFHQHHQTVL
jgi:titin